MSTAQKSIRDMVPPKVRENMRDIKHKVVILSGKGGVGKTTVATNLAMAFARDGLETGVLDVDIYGPNVPKLLGLEGQHPAVEGESILPVVGPLGVRVMSMAFLLRNRDDAVAWRGPLVAKVIGQFLGDVRWGALDMLVVDLPPGTGDEILSILQSIPDIDGVIIVSTPQEVAVLDASRAVRLVKKMGVPVLGIVENMSEFVCPECGSVHKLFGDGATRRAAEQYDIELLGSLPLDPRVVTFSDKGTPFVIMEPESRVAGAFNALVTRLREKMEV